MHLDLYSLACPLSKSLSLWDFDVFSLHCELEIGQVRRPTCADMGGVFFLRSCQLPSETRRSLLFGKPSDIDVIIGALDLQSI